MLVKLKRVGTEHFLDMNDVYAWLHEDMRFNTDIKIVKKIEDISTVLLDFTDYYSLSYEFITCGKALSEFNKPISVYCLRHSIELSLKMVISKYDSSNDLLKRHNLINIYNSAVSKVTVGYYKEKLMSAKSILLDISKMDCDTGENVYRYPSLRKNFNRFDVNIPELISFSETLLKVCVCSLQLDINLVMQDFKKIAMTMRTFADTIKSDGIEEDGTSNDNKQVRTHD